MRAGIRSKRFFGGLGGDAAHAIGGGGNGGFSLPFGVGFSSETNGVTPDGWTAGAGADPNVMPVVADSIFTGGYKPPEKILHFNSDASNMSAADYAFPEAIDVTNGIRMALWIGYQAQAASTWHGFANGVYGGAAVDGFSCAPNRAGPYDVDRYSYVDWSWTKAAAGASLSNSQYYYQFRHQWNPTLNQVTTSMLTWGTAPGAEHWGPTTWTCDTGVDSAFTTLTHFFCRTNKQTASYYRDVYLVGLWVGNTTDAWPASDAPPT